jgi:O-antigen/teichoic acid export membrane protein
MMKLSHPRAWGASFWKRMLPAGISVRKEQIREFSWLAGGQALTILLSLISIKLVATIGAAEYAKYVLALSVGGMLNLAMYGPMEQGYIRMLFYYGDKPAARETYFSSLRQVLFWCLGALLVVAGVGIALGRLVFAVDVPFAIAAAGMIIVAATAIPVTGMLGALRLRREVSIIATGERILFIGFLFSVRWMSPLNATLVLACTALSTGLSFIVRLAFFNKQARPREGASVSLTGPERNELRKEIYSRVVDYARPFLLWGGISWVQSNGERWVIEGVMTNADVGRYGLAANLVNNSAVLVVGVLGQFLGPIIFRQFSSSSDAEQRKGKEIIRLNTLLTLAVFGSAGIILALMGDSIIHFVSNRDFTMNGHILLLLTFGLGAYYVGQAMSTMGMARNQPGIYLRPKTISAGISIVLYYSGCVLWGLTGLVAGLLVANLIYVFLIWRANRRLEEEFEVHAESIR